MVLNVEIFIRCKCGHTISAREFLQIRVYLKPGEPTFVNAQFQCNNCRQVGEHHLVAEEILQQASQMENNYLPGPVQDEEDGEMIIDIPGSVLDRRQQSEEAITCDELIDFHFQLERMNGRVPEL